tara:strand:- start:327 stop:707 length:381 start_codon:yes stop_codon:yes gene_type:complete
MMTEQEETILDVDEKELAVRLDLLRGKLLEASKALRAQVPSTLPDQALTENGFFKQWVICNTVYDSSLKDTNNEDFNRMLYYMFEESGGNIAQLLNQYDLKVDLNSAGQLENIELIILETETTDAE